MEPVIPPTTRSFVVWRICLTSFHAIAVSSTLFRLYHRVRTHRWWWDDTFACPALIADCVYLATLWVLPDLPRTQAAQARALWFGTLPFEFLLGFVRVSLALSIARIFPSWQTAHRIIIYLTIVIALAYSALVILFGVSCGLPHAITWSPMPLGFATCKYLQRFALATISVDIIFDSFLIAIPLITLWNIKLPRNQRRLVLAGFSSGIWTAVSSVTGAVVLLRYSTPFLAITTPHIEAILSLLSCNFLVIITVIYRVFRGVRDLEDPSCDSEYTSEPSRPSLGVVPTTIVLTEPSDIALDGSPYDSIRYTIASTAGSFPRNPSIPVYPANNSRSGSMGTSSPRTTQLTQSI